MFALLLQLGLGIVGTAVVWQGSVWLERSSERIAARYALPAVVEGAVLVAVGSSFPELSSTVLATAVHGDFDLGVAAIVGSAIFNVLVIPGLSGLAGGGLESDRTLVYKDAQFYIIAVAALLLVFSLALIYDPVEGEGWVGTVSRPLALLPLALYGLYLFLQQQDAADERSRPREGEGGGRVEVPSARQAGPAPRGAARDWGLLVIALALIVAGVEALVRAAIELGALLGTPSFLWGITLVAVGTSLPDAFVSVRAARRGRGVVSLANVLGSNSFDLLVAVPVGVLIAGSSTVDFALAAPMMGVLTLATVVLFAMLRTGLRLTRVESALLLALYAAFVVWIALETAGVSGLVF